MKITKQKLENKCVKSEYELRRLGMRDQIVCSADSTKLGSRRHKACSA